MAELRVTSEQLVKEVKIILDENDSSDALVALDEINQLQTDEIIEHLIPTAIDRVASLAPMSMLVDMAQDMDLIEADWDMSDPYCQKLTLDPDMMRIAYVRLKGWERGVTDIISDSDPLYAQYRSKFAGIRPDTVDPAAAATQGFAGDIILECYPKMGTTENLIKYIPLSSRDGQMKGEYQITGQIYRAVLYMIANLYYVTLGDSNRAALMAAQVKEIIGMTESETAANTTQQ